MESESEALAQRLLPAAAGGGEEAAESAHAPEPEPEPASAAAPRARRMLALDIFRGLAIVGMIVVDNQGDPDAVYQQLDEDFWDGLRLCNFMFPSFVFILGAALPLALSRAAAQSRRKTLQRLAWRGGALFAIGLTLNIMAGRFHAPFRIMGVLQRLGLCFFVCGALLRLLHARPWAQRAVVAALAGAYQLLLSLLPLRGCARGSLAEGCNAAQRVDAAVFGRFRHAPTDPEGLPSTLTAVLTCWFGVEMGKLVLERGRSAPSSSSSSSSSAAASSASSAPQLLLSVEARWALLGAGGVAGGVAAWAAGSPWNKKLWTPSFALLMGGFGALAVAAIDAAERLWARRCGRRGGAETVPLAARPLVWVGRNPLVVFVGMVLLEIVLTRWVEAVPLGNQTVTLWAYIFERGFRPWLGPPKLASLVVSLLHLLLWTAVAGALHRANLFVTL